MSDVQQNTDWISRIASGLAVLLSMSSIIIAFLELSTIQEQQQAEVWPYLQIKGSYSQEGFSLQLQNKGVGPALTADINLLNGQEEFQNLERFIRSVSGPEKAFGHDVYRGFIPDNTVIGVGEMCKCFRFLGMMIRNIL